MHTFHPATHSWVEGEVKDLDEDLAIFKVIRRRGRSDFLMECLAGDDGICGSLSEDDREVVIAHSVQCSESRYLDM